jgi:hypothetical protein
MAKCVNEFGESPGHGMSGSIARQFVLSIAALFIFNIMPIAQANEISSVSEVIETEDVAGEMSAPKHPFIAQFGPFFVTSASSVEMRGVIDATTKQHFSRMMLLYPRLRRIDMVDCPGSEDDDAALDLDRMIRAARLDTHIPSDGSIRSGAVELFLAGVHRTADPGAELGVHSWRDEDGREARDFSPADPVHAAYVNYYVEMGLDPAVARDFYTFTNRVASFDNIHYLTPAELARFRLTN